MFGAARERGMSSNAVVKEAVDEGAVSRLESEGLRVDVEETTERVSGSRSRSRLERVESLVVVVRRRRASSSFGDCEAPEEPVSLLHMVAMCAQRMRVGCY